MTKHQTSIAESIVAEQNSRPGINKLLKIAFVLSVITIVYNLAEGLVSVYFGIEDDTLSLLGFGLDSFVEVISGIGIAHMVWRMQRNPLQQRDRFEKQALKVTGTSFYLLTASLVIGSVLKAIQGSQPETTVVGIIVSLVSILTMFFLMRYKLDVGNKLNSAPIIADAHCTRACLQLSVILLVASGLYELFRIGYVDLLGSLGIAYFAYKEGKEAWEKARSSDLNSCCSGN
ncbi:cation transporter [Pontibacter anaerobius]|uniref:Cation transporter n=1 Tax=Pontibacter anaerobius TaxID=2993940 RepID=A0ABT3RB81_9BACT|nr:cation transporter [Pontibacter anaerobius]MCX2738693.1 cation transporter [Pontibacter anaerobius]